MRQSPYFQKIVRLLVEHRFMLSLGLSAACGITLNSLFPMNAANALLRLIEMERPAVFHAIVGSYGLFLYSTPFLVCSMLFSLLYVHLYKSEQELAAGTLPPYPDPHTRTELCLVLGEVHRQLVPISSHSPRWLSIPRARTLHGYCFVRLYRIWKNVWANFAGDAPVIRVSRRRPRTQTVGHRP